MSLAARLALSCLLLFCLVLPARAAGPFGSETLLRALWTEAQLAGSPADRVVTKPWAAPPDTSPPARTVPQVRLPAVPEALRGVVRRVNPARGERVVALTFDLCERASNVAGYQNEIVDFLRKNRVPATFFAGGKWMRSHPEKAMQLMADPLFQVGNHTWTHANLAVMDEPAAREQVLWAQAEYELLREELARRAAAKGLSAEMAGVPEAIRVFRLPYGRNKERDLGLLASLGLPVIQWDVLGEVNDGAWPPEKSAAHALKRVKPGSIILLHANAVPKNTQHVVPVLVRGLQKAGYRFVTVGELLETGPAETVTEGYFAKPGDNVQYDTLFLGKGTLHPRPEQPETPRTGQDSQ